MTRTISLQRNILTLLVTLLSNLAWGVSTQAQDASVCKDLVSKLEALGTRRLSSVGLYAEATGAITYTRVGDGNPAIFSGLLVYDGATRSYPVPAETSNLAFSMAFGRDPGFAPSELSGKASILLPARYDRIGFAFVRASGRLRWQSYTWTRGVNNVDTTRCTKIGSVVLDAAHFPSATLEQRTVPIVQVDALDDFPGYGSDSFRIVIRPRSYSLD